MDNNGLNNNFNLEAERRMTIIHSYNNMNKTNLRTKACTIVFTIFVFILYCLKSLKPSERESGMF